MSKGNRKVLLITPSIDMGGMQRAMTNLANGLVEIGVEVEMFALFRNSHFYELNKSVSFSENPQDTSKQNSIGRLLSVLSEIRKAAKKCTSKVIVSYGRYYSSLVMLATLGLGKKVYISDRASLDYRDTFVPDLVTRLICRYVKPAGIIAQTSQSAEFQLRRFKDRTLPIRVIPNAVNISISERNQERENIVLAVGRFGDSLKGFDRLIESWGKTKRDGWRLVFAGGCESEAPEYGVRAKELGCYDSIDFLGKVNNISEWYSRASIFVIPSRSEGFPNALAEAMCAGLCCISFDFNSGPRDIIKDGEDGIIVPDGDVDALARAISEMIKNKEKRLRLGNNAIKLNDVLRQDKICKKVADFIFNEE